MYNVHAEKMGYNVNNLIQHRLPDRRAGADRALSERPGIKAAAGTD